MKSFCLNTVLIAYIATKVPERRPTLVDIQIMKEVEEAFIS